MERYELVYDYCSTDGDWEEKNIHEEVEMADWYELKEYIKQMRKNGCYNIDAALLGE